MVEISNLLKKYYIDFATRFAKITLIPVSKVCDTCVSQSVYILTNRTEAYDEISYIRPRTDRD